MFSFISVSASVFNRRQLFSSQNNLSSLVVRKTSKAQNLKVQVVCATHEPKGGRITLVSVGPGPLHHMTSEAKRALEDADAVFHDRLIDPLILNHIRSDADIISVGKGRGVGTGSQANINQMLVQYIRKGLHVVRVKGGDAAIFGRLGEELSAVKSTGAQVTILPGVTAASAVASSLSFPLTSAQGGVCFASAHDQAPWLTPQLIQHVTVALYMPLADIGSVCHRLVLEGGPDVATKPAVAVQAVYSTKQRVVWGFVQNIDALIKEAGLQSPSLVIIGDVIRIAKDWPYGDQNIISYKT